MKEREIVPHLGPRPRWMLVFDQNPPTTLSEAERTRLLKMLHQPEHVDLAVTQVWARLLDAGTYLCSIATMFRILRDPARTVNVGLSGPIRPRPNRNCRPEPANAIIGYATAAYGIDRDQVTIHADRGSSMTSKPVAQLLVDLGMTRTHSRPHVSYGNPYSEANFKPLKYCPAFPGRAW